jgi:bacillolysin/thermolysin
VGLGTGVWGDRKKVSADSWSGIFRAEDRLRPPALATYDLRGSPSAFAEALSTGRIDSSLLAADADNDWTDGAVVDAHAYAGWTYDYYFKRHQRRGLDGLDLPTRSVTHFLPRSWGFANAFWDPFSSAMYYGDGDAEFAAFSGALDVVAHELTHGVTQHTWDGVYEGESGALNEAFSDVMATGVEFFHQPEGAARLHATTSSERT